MLFAASLLVVGLLALNGPSRPGDSVAATSDACAGLSLSDCMPFVNIPAPQAEEQLARKHAPIVYLPDLERPCRAGGAALDPVPVDIVLDNPEVSLRRLSDPSFVKWAPSARDLYEAPRDPYFDYYLDFPGDPSNPGCRYEVDGLRFAGESPRVAYARITRQEGHEGLVLQYWLFYYFNDWNNDHEGDWELVQLHFNARTAAEALRTGPDEIALSQHRTGEVAAWKDDRVRREGDRPVVFVALGSHANYFHPGIYLGRGEAGRGLGCDDASRSGRRTPLEVRLLTRRPVGPSDPVAWLAFTGYWGDAERKDSAGSTALVTKQNWLRPLTWQERLGKASVSLPSEGDVGTDAARAFCSAVAFGSDVVLPFYRDLPLITALALGLTSAGILGSLARTRYLPVQVLPWRSRRRLGQVLTTAIEIYRRHAYVFLTLGLISFPAGLAAAQLREAVSLPLLAARPLLPEAGIAVEAVSALAQGVLHLGIAYALAAAATTAVIGSLERGRGAEASDGLFEVARRLPALLASRFTAICIVGVLALTVVGIPLAFRQALRWAFLEHAVLLDRCSARAAFARSARLVSGNWLWSVMTVLLFGFAALLAAPAIGVAMIMALKAVPPIYINLATAAIYALLVPYFAIAFSLVYFDLHSRRVEEK